MEISSNGVRFIEQREQYAAIPYRDQGGNWTWGYGHKQLPGEAIPTFVSQRQALVILDHDLAWAEHAVAWHVTVPLSQPEFDALVSFTFNVGAAALYSSTLLRVLNSDDYADVPAQMKRWVYVDENGQMVVSQGLLRRRIAEGRLFSEGVY
jgi:lysozyme